MARKQHPSSRTAATRDDAPPRIIGGRLRGRLLAYSGQLRTRPMKDRTREAIFNLLGPAVAGKHAIDLFAGTGALALEAISRGAARATLIERHFPTARLIEESSANLDLGETVQVVAADVFLWARSLPDDDPLAWVVFCSPPYDFYVDRLDQMLELIQRLCLLAPPQSLLVVEADDRFDLDLLPHSESWDRRRYAPAQIAILEKSEPQP